MKQKVMIAAGSQCFEFEGEIVEIENDYLILKAKHGDIYIERKFLVFIQYLHDEEPMPVVEKVKPQVDAAAKFINTRLRHDPVDEMLQSKFVPPSQLPDEQPWCDYDEDEEAARNVYGAIHGETPVTKTNNLKDAVKAAMGTDTDFAMGMSGGKYKDPAQTILGMKNGSSKKNRSS